MDAPNFAGMSYCTRCACWFHAPGTCNCYAPTQPPVIPYVPCVPYVQPTPYPWIVTWSTSGSTATFTYTLNASDPASSK